MFVGETELSKGGMGNIGRTCEDCGEELVMTVNSSMCGYYVGTWCGCGPNSRETGYFKTASEADRALQLIKKGDFMNPNAKVRV